jgi:hypothetical protein
LRISPNFLCWTSLSFCCLCWGISWLKYQRSFLQIYAQTG